RFLTAIDVRNKKRVCVIGSEIHETLFEGVDPINKKMKIGRFDFRVVGVMEEQGSAGTFGGPNFDSQIFVPVTTFIKSFGGRNRSFDIAVKAPPGLPLEDFEFVLQGEMRRIRRLKPGEDDNFSINQMDNLVAMFNNVMGVVVGIGMLVTGISLFVGAIGVMNIMFVSVTERTREIGIRKAIGARRNAILTQFLFESSSICMVGGLIGTALAFGVASLIDRFLMPATVSWPIVGVAILVSLSVGVASGILPAYRASRLNPIEALRYE
ncbi:MAG: ABC transporter permease, partial [Thermoanaerobaculales bacterium]|nr:ABC transporter permease [Thermoanaerobaculales bacterium]